MSHLINRGSQPSEVLVEMGRLKALSDGVVAVALTLLVFGIRLPEGTAADDLSGNLLALGPVLLVYLITFAIIGGAWGSHQRMLGQIRRADGLLVWYTLLSLLPVTLLPVCAALLGAFPDQTIALAIFATDAFAIQLTAFLLWRHASHHGLVDPALDARVIDGIGRRLALNASLFALSIPLGLVNAALAYGLWIAVFALVFTTDWLSWQQSISTVEESIDSNGARSARIQLNHTAGGLRVGVLDDEGGALLEGVFGGGVEKTVRREGERTELELALPRHRGLLSPRYPWAWGRFSADWSVGLSKRVALSLVVDTADASAELELDGVRLTELELTANASLVEIGLPSSAGPMVVAVHARSSAVIIRIPAGVAAWVHGEQEIVGLDIDDARFPAVVGHREYRSADFAERDDRVEVSLSLSGSAVRIV